MSAMWKGGEVGMTEQEKREKREKVIKGLGSCVEYFACKVKGVMFDEWLEESRKAIALLKAQEPRVMTLEEVKILDSDYYYLESMRSPGKELREIVGTYGLTCVTWPGITWARQTMGDSGYGKTWRCWTSRPTDEQRKVTPWETGTANG